MAEVLYYYGARQDSIDPRDFKVVYSQSQIPSSSAVDLRKYISHVYNQGRLGSCTANALCAAYGLDLKKQATTLSGGYLYFDPSRLFLYYNTREYEGTTQHDAGASIRDTVKALNRKGVCKETDWPYVTRNYSTKPPASCYAAAQGNNFCKYERLDQDINQLRACLSDNCPFVFGFNIYQSFHDYSNQHHGQMPMPSYFERSREPEGRHAAVAIGYDDIKRHVIILNSWGETWGDKGYFYMPYEFITDPSTTYDLWKVSFACEQGLPGPNHCSPGGVYMPPLANSEGYGSGVDVYSSECEDYFSDYDGYTAGYKVKEACCCTVQ